MQSNAGSWPNKGCLLVKKEGRMSKVHSLVLWIGALE